MIISITLSTNAWWCQVFMYSMLVFCFLYISFSYAWLSEWVSFFILICRFSLRLIICKTPLVLTYRSKGLIRKLWLQLVQHLNWMVHIQLRFCLQFCVYSFIFSPGTSSASLFGLALLLYFQSYLQIILERLPAMQRSYSGIHAQQAARLQELVEFIQSQVFYYYWMG